MPYHLAVASRLLNSDLSSASKNNENIILHHDDGTLLERLESMVNLFARIRDMRLLVCERTQQATERSLREWHICFGYRKHLLPSRKVGQGLTGTLFCNEEKNDPKMRSLSQMSTSSRARACMQQENRRFEKERRTLGFSRLVGDPASILGDTI